MQEKSAERKEFCQSAKNIKTAYKILVYFLKIEYKEKPILTWIGICLRFGGSYDQG